MKGYRILSESYKQAAAEGKISKAEAAEECRIFDFLTECSEEDAYRLFDSGAFNDIAKAYTQRAVRELIEEGTIDEGQGSAIRKRFAFLLGEITAREIVE